MATKVAHKRYVGGLEAPRNSLELQMETSYDLYSARDNILYTPYDMGNESFGTDYHLTEASIKKLISREISEKAYTRQNVPSIVARLMGVDVLPFDSKSTARVIDTKNVDPTSKSMDKKTSRKSLSKCSQQTEVSSFGHYGDTNHVKLSKPKPREHPQEEELQKFKKEFEAWQAARFKECTECVDVSCDPSQLIAQEDLNREKMLIYSNSKRTTNEPNHTNVKIVDPYSNRLSRANCKDSKLIDIVSGPTKIVILRPGPPERIDTVSDNSWSTSEDERSGCIEDFLEEVKERLKLELQGRCPKKSTSIRGGGIETPYWERPLEAQPIIARNAKNCLLRSESTRSFMSERFQFVNGTPENDMKAEANRGVAFCDNLSRFSISNYGGKAVHASINDRNGSFMNKFEKESGMHDNDLSPRNLIRSLSAPVTGTSFGKLLLEDRHVFTGAQIRRKQEVIEKVSLNIKKQKKDKFNIRERVSSFRYSLTLRHRLPFRRRVKSAADQSRSNLLKEDITSGPRVVTCFCERETHENSTEVPPSPASVCSSVQEEFWRQADYPSPISSSAAGHHQLEDSEMSNVFSEINSNLNELRRKLDQFKGSFSEETMKEEQVSEGEADIEDQTEAYIRDLLIAAGLYGGVTFSKKSLSKWDPLGKLISSRVFEEVEEAYVERYRCRENHKLILDLLNEILPTLLREPVCMPRVSLGKIPINWPVQKKLPPSGRELLSHVWSIIRDHIYPPADRSFYALDNVLARDFRSTLWSNLMDDDVNALGRDLESQIIGDMIYEMVEDIVTTSS
ncbi:hypothetical protein STAS_22710 [Striga asiatica]|uniref:DUF4378 domain-containing protein n=1 Tax=Striga asiatica TaxID=4170 RepID=A0A5A7QKR3_STRAF|nr:hypothetical protein STAS_22710 [Striga asiatica]